MARPTRADVHAAAFADCCLRSGVVPDSGAHYQISVWKLGKYIERIGPRKAGAIAAVCWGGGLITAGVGATMHALPLLYAGYGCLGGTATTMTSTSFFYFFYFFDEIIPRT